MVGLFFEAPVLFLAWYAWLDGVKDRGRMVDFMAVLSGSRALVHGVSPYQAAVPKLLSQGTHLVYPPLVGYLFVPFGVLPYRVAAPLYFLLLIGAVLATLAVLGVRDWRCYGIVFLWYPTLSDFATGALGPLMALLLALGWRYRERALVAVPVLAVAVVAKLFLWPVLVWLLATRRVRTALLTAIASAAAFAVPFGLLGLKTFRGYPHFLRVLDQANEGSSLSSAAFLRAFGAGVTVAHAIVFAVGAALILLAVVLGLKRGGDRGVFTVIVLVALLTTPIVWMHYYFLLVVPIALARPRLSGLWFIPLLYWLSPTPQGGGLWWRLVVALGVTLTIAVVAARRGAPISSATGSAAPVPT